MKKKTVRARIIITAMILLTGVAMILNASDRKNSAAYDLGKQVTRINSDQSGGKIVFRQLRYGVALFKNVHIDAPGNLLVNGLIDMLTGRRIDDWIVDRWEHLRSAFTQPQYRSSLKSLFRKLDATGFVGQSFLGAEFLYLAGRCADTPDKCFAGAGAIPVYTPGRSRRLFRHDGGVSLQNV